MTNIPPAALEAAMRSLSAEFAVSQAVSDQLLVERVLDAVTPYMTWTANTRLDRLDDMLANLQAHIDQRAAELAQPLIDETREAALADIRAAQDKQQRAEDLVAEMRRQFVVLERHNQRYQGRAGAIRLLHPSVMHEGGRRCGTCSDNEAWPCRTVRALDGQE